MNKADILRRVGDIGQIAGIKRYQMTEGRSDGLRACDVDNGSGLSFTVLESRCLDIFKLQYKGTNISFVSKAGLSGRPENFHKIFRGGMLYTCGLLNIGPSGLFEGKELEIHGSIGKVPAENVATNARWEGEDFVMDVNGEMKESSLFGENLLFSRKISTKYGSKTISICDQLENLDFQDQEFMLLYHFNFGYPLLDEGARVIIPSINVIPRNSDAEAGLSNSSRVIAPMDGLAEQVFYHEVACDESGDAFAALINDNINLGVYLKYKKAQLPELIQWKSMKSGDYAMGLEPANCRLGGREVESSTGAIKKIAPMQTINFELEIGILDGKEEIKSFCAKLGK